MNIKIGDRYDLPTFGYHAVVTDIIEDEEWCANTFLELVDTVTGVKHFKCITNTRSNHYLDPTTLVRL